MYRKVLIGGAVCAAIVGVGGAAVAATGSSSTTSGSGTTSTAAHHKGHGDGLRLNRLGHGQFVVKGKDGKWVTDDVINGDVTAVSTTSITVKAGDGVSETYAVTKDTKIRLREKGSKPTDVTVDKAAKGTHVMVLGTGTSTLTATRIVVLVK